MSNSNLRSVNLVWLMTGLLVACSDGASDELEDGASSRPDAAQDAPSRIPDPITGGCKETGKPDVLDGVDDDCDGIDGVVTDTVFVRPGASPTAAGTGNDPVGSLARALELARRQTKHHVYLCVGALEEGAIELEVTSDLHIHGGFTCADWSRGSDRTLHTRWNSSASEALRIRGGAHLSLERVELTAADASSAAASSVAISAWAVADFVITDSIVRAGNGAAGAAGATGTAQQPVARSAPGGSAWSPGVDVPAKPQACGGSDYAGSGGAAAARSRRDGDAGGNSSDGVDGGDWRTQNLGLTSAYATGSDGAPGAPGAPAVGVAAPRGTIVEGRYVAGVGPGGSPGGRGTSGGGGAPGEAIEVCKGHVVTVRPSEVGYTWLCDEAPILRGGGGGGAGGCYGLGGAAGGGGQSGGASIALLVEASEVRLGNVQLVTGAGGAGGAAGAGAPGQVGGEGGFGGSGSAWGLDFYRTRNGEAKAGYTGFPGGRGGDGAPGGAGAPGSGGPAAGIYVVGAAPVVDPSTTYRVGAGGAGGAGVGGVADGSVGVTGSVLHP